MPDIRIRLGVDVLVIDGAFGTMLQRYDIPAEQSPAQLNLTAPEIIEDIHRNYRLAGADCITSNTFGANRPKLAEYGLEDQLEQINRAGVKLARSSGAPHVLADIGPTGRVLAPLGDASFDELFEVFAEQAAALAAENPDAILIETMTDIAEARCAVLAARSVCDLPVFVTCTFGLSGRMDLSGTAPATAVVILQAAGAEAIGLNCGLGPEQMLPLVEQAAAVTDLPLLVLPNAGLPRLEHGETVFPGTPDQMGEHAAKFVDAGASLVGSCCGSTPEFTGAIFDFVQGKQVRADRVRPAGVQIAGPRGHTSIGSGALTVIGERINPTGKPALADSLREESMTVVRSFAVEQQHAGADALDVNVGAPGVDATQVLPAAIIALAGTSDLPLVIDCTEPAALEAALRVYPGRALVNSINGSADSIDSILPIAKRYGAAVLVLALDDDGIPDTVQGRLEIVEHVRKAAHGVGLTDSDLVVDCLVLTAATDPNAARTTLDAVREVSDRLGLATVLGVSNVSHGLPGRPALNAAFLAMARASGLDAAIVNPSDRDVVGAIKAADTLLGNDKQAQDWVAWSAAVDAARATAAPATAAVADGTPNGGPQRAPAGSDDLGLIDTGGQGQHAEVPDQGLGASADLAAAVVRGDTDAAPDLVEAVIAQGMPPGEVIGSVLTPAIQELGDKFGRGEVFLPQLMVAAEAMKVAVERVKSHLPEGEGSSAGKVVFATVKGDIHSIGKDICVSLLESQGFEVDDLGVDVPADVIVEASGDADATCLSALMTTTLPAMQDAVTRLADERPGLPVFVGGAVVTREWADSIGAGYSDDAPGCVNAVRSAVVSKGA